MTTQVETLLAIDNGTQSVRAILFDLSGNIVAKSQIHFDPPYFSIYPGWAEHDVQDYWQAVCDACQALWSQPNIHPECVKGVAITTQRGTVVNLDQAGNPLRAAITWLDQRRTDNFPKINLAWRTAFMLARVEDTIRHFQSEAEINWIHTHQHEIWEKTDKFLLLSGYLNYQMCGRFIDSIGSQVGYLPFDYKRQTWAPSHDWKWQGLAIKPSMLPSLIAPGTLIGTLHEKAARQTGLLADTPLIAAAADKACEAIGAGCRQSHIGCISYGTTATINIISKKYIEVIPWIPPYPSAIADAYSAEVQIFRGYWMVKWFKEQFGQFEMMQAAEHGLTAESLFDELIAAVPPGAMGLMLQPYWSPGLKLPGPEAKGAIIGFGDVHNRGYMYRAILEGLAYSLREGKERIEKCSKTLITELRVSGGGSQSDAAMQLTADIFGLPTIRPHLYETSALGAAINAAVGLNYYPNFEQAINAMTRISQVFLPEPKNQAIYDALYLRVYRKMYERLQPLYKEIRAITGYPENQ